LEVAEDLLDSDEEFLDYGVCPEGSPGMTASWSVAPEWRLAVTRLRGDG
jgi:hypothetical protein